MRVTLHDDQQLYAVVKGRRHEPDGSWWYDLQIHLPAANTTWGRLRDEPAPVDFRAPAGRCESIDGQPYEGFDQEIEPGDSTILSEHVDRYRTMLYSA